MTDVEQRLAAKAFAERWQGRGYEKGETSLFWIELLRTVFGVANPEHVIIFEAQVQLGHTSFIDATLPDTRVVIEQKSLDVDLNKPAKQSDGSSLTPYQQAKRYADELEFSKKPRYIVVCNFREFHVHDMEHPHDAPQVIRLEDLPKEYYRLAFLVDNSKAHLKREMELSIKAGEIVGRLYDAILKHYHDPTSAASLKSLNMLCVRLVFCLYAEDAGIFGKKNQFHDYLARFDAQDLRRALIDLFRILNTKEADRDPYEHADLLAFPYVNGGLFAETTIEIPQFDEATKNLLLERASDDFDWSAISPTIFGAVFESTLNPETRRSGGMHYTSIENIHKVIDPLFLTDLAEELDTILAQKALTTRTKLLRAYQDKLARLTFLDPACGSGNFLTETYLSLRRLENRVLAAINQGQAVLGLDDVIKVSIGQFYGIEINDFAVTVAKTALWIAESQMMRETEDIVHRNLDFLPLKSYANIIEANALRLDWSTLIPKERLNYIMGNPPFVGQAKRSNLQSKDMEEIFGAGSSENKLDYVLCWYKKAMDFIKDSEKKILIGFVSTNSICQGESVPTFWKRLFAEGAEIIFAHRSFKWNNESNKVAAVVCVIIGFTNKGYLGNKYIYDEATAEKVSYINAYLHDAPDVWITSRSNTPPMSFPKMTKGSEPTDSGKLFLNSEEKLFFETKYPQLRKYIKPFVGGDEYLSNKQGVFTRFCFWFLHSNPADYANIKEIKDRLTEIAQKRQCSSADRIRKKSAFPYLFCQIRQPESNYLLFPRHTTSNRRYIPLGYLDKDTIVGDACYIIPNAPLFMFGVMMSNVHMAWVNLVCGRLGNGFRYSPAIYNNFPWPEVTDAQRAAIEQTAQGILDARALYPDCSLADLYDETTMPPELRKAHQANDRAVLKAYGYPTSITESAIVADLMNRYQALTEK